ncbi:SAP30-binding protein-like [Bicyclus anynana]|uniref:SAP30-binding protein-like n=1 Tax=Bicyclus anynana TaxID=110368 RepID=A0A6J1N1W0_BICAN|nr:SAP30-binding protein-like [Bicyclus anynana]
MTSKALAFLTAAYTDTEGEEDVEDGQTADMEAAISTKSSPASLQNTEKNKRSWSALPTFRSLVSYTDDPNVSEEEDLSLSTENQDDLRRFFMDTNTNEATPCSDAQDSDSGVEIPPEPPGKCSQELQDTIAKYHHRMVTEGLDLNKLIQEKKSFRNPSLYEKLIEFCDINEVDTNYAPEIYDPWKWGKESYYDELAKAQDAAMQKRKKEKRERLLKKRLIRGVAKKSHSDDKKQKSKWDQAAPNVAANVIISEPGLLVPPLPSNIKRTNINPPTSTYVPKTKKSKVTEK